MNRLVITVLLVIMLFANSITFIPLSFGQENNYLRVYFSSAVVNGISLSASNPTITVSPGSRISGYLEVIVDNNRGGAWITPVIGTVSWSRGWHTCISRDAPSGRSTQRFNFDLTAPNTPGTYYIGVFTGWMYSCDEVASNDHPPQYGDGDDVWDMSQQGWEQVITNGQASTGPYRQQGRAIRVVVQQQQQDTTPPTVRVLAPNGGETLTVGQTFRIRWEASDNVGVSYVHIWLFQGGSQVAVIATNQPNTGYYDWTVPNRPGTGYKIRVAAVDAAGNAGYDDSDGTFAIHQQPQAGSLTIRIHNIRGLTMPQSGGSLDVSLYKWDSSRNQWMFISSRSVTYQGGVEFVATSFSNLELNKYYYFEVKHIPASGLMLREYWGWFRFILTSRNSSATVDFYRSRPYITNVDYPPSAISGGQITFSISTKNEDTQSRTLYLTVILDRDLRPPFDVMQNSTVFTLASGETRSISIALTAPAPGTYKPYIMLSFYYPSDPSIHKTVYDQWDGSPRPIEITAQQQVSLSVQPTSWSPTVQSGSSASQTFTVSVSGGTARGVTVSRVSGPSWLAINPTNLGDIASGQSRTFTITASPPFGTSGQFSYKIRVSGSNTAPVEIQGTINIQQQPSATAKAQIGIRHTYIGDLRIWIGVQGGREVLIWNREGGSADEIFREFDLFQLGFTQNDLPPSENKRWYLKVRDEAEGDTGRIEYFKIIYQGQVYESQDHPEIRDFQEAIAWIPSHLGPQICPTAIMVRLNYFGIWKIEDSIRGREKWYQFSIPATSGVWINIDGSGEGDVALQLYQIINGDLKIVAQNDDRWNERNKPGLYRVVEKGTYCIKLYEKGRGQVNYLLTIDIDTLVDRTTIDIGRDGRALTLALFRDDVTEYPAKVSVNSPIFLKSIVYVQYMDGRVVGYEEQEITGIKIKEWNHMIAFDRRRGPDYLPGTTWILGQSFLVWPTTHPELQGVTKEVLENLLTVYKNYQIWNIVLRSATILIDLIPVIGVYISTISNNLLDMLQVMQIISTDPHELIEKLAEAVNPNQFVYTREWLPFPTAFGVPDVRVSLVDKEFQLQFINQGTQEVIIISIVKLDIPLSFDREAMLYLSPKFEVIG